MNSNAIIEVYRRKFSALQIDRGDFVYSEDDPQWKTLHPLGPVHFQFRCQLCGAVLATDMPLRSLDLTDATWSRLSPHFETCVPNPDAQP